MEKLFNKYERGQVQQIDWLDHLAFKAMEQVKERESPKNGNNHLSLIVDFCSFEHRVVFQVGTSRAGSLDCIWRAHYSDAFTLIVCYYQLFLFASVY